jgi:hypothetical protein
MASRLIQITGLDYLSTFEEIPQVLSQTLALIQTSFRNKYKICSFLASQINDMLETLVNYASRKENQIAYKVVETAVQSYMNNFFGEVPNIMEMDFDKILGQEITDVKEDLLCSFKMFDEGYHYMKKVKEVILYQLVPLMLNEFQEVLMVSL